MLQPAARFPVIQYGILPEKVTIENTKKYEREFALIKKDTDTFYGDEVINAFNRIEELQHSKKTFEKSPIVLKAIDEEIDKLKFKITQEYVKFQDMQFKYYKTIYLKGAEKLNKKLEENESIIKNKDRDIKIINLEHKSLSNKFIEANKTAEKSKKELGEVELQLKIEEAHHEVAKKKCTALEKKCTDAQNSVNNLRKNLADTMKQLDTEETSKKRAYEEIKQLKQQCEEHERETKRLNTENETLIEEKNLLGQTNNKQLDELETLRKTNERFNKLMDCFKEVNC